MSDRARLDIVHHSRLFRRCLASMLAENSDLRVSEVDHELDSDELFAYFLREQPEITLVDLALPDRFAIELAKLVKEHASKTKIVILVSAANQHLLADCVGAGADAWVHEESSLEELRTAVQDVSEGRTFCASRLLEPMVAQFADMVRNAQWRDRAQSVNLTQREWEILALISDRLSNKQIAKRLSISLYTVKNHVHNILEKLDVESRYLAVDYVRQRRWLSESRPAANPHD